MRARLLLLTLIAIALLPARARADRVERLIKILRTDESYKVRLQTAIALGKLKDKRAVPALSGALNDSEYTVRALSAAALGQIGDRSALPALQRLIRREKHNFVLNQAKRAMAVLQSAPSSAGARFYVTVGKIGNKANKGGTTLTQALAAALIKEFSKVSGVTTQWSGGRRPSAADLKKSGLKAFVLDGAVLSVSGQPSGGGVDVSCSIKVSLATFPQNSMKAFYSGGASMQVSASEFTPATELSLYKEIIAGAAQGAREQIVQSYLSTQ